MTEVTTEQLIGLTRRQEALNRETSGHSQLVSRLFRDYFGERIAPEIPEGIRVDISDDAWFDPNEAVYKIHVDCSSRTPESVNGSGNEIYRKISGLCEEYERRSPWIDIEVTAKF